MASRRGRRVHHVFALLCPISLPTANASSVATPGARRVAATPRTRARGRVGGSAKPNQQLAASKDGRAAGGSMLTRSARSKAVVRQDSEMEVDRCDVGGSTTHEVPIDLLLL
jgi:hypothetical protein